ncbi:MAG TPA: carbohydrate ABC transporter permease, partial [Clostridia bacterium]|nr:carbohydrate ABC transporter permease [Clostridia bacterium]
MTQPVRNRIQKSASDKAFDAVNIAAMLLFMLVMIYPLYFIVIASLSDPYRVLSGKVYLWPSGLTLEAYENVFRESRIWTGYSNTLRYTALGTLLNLALTIPAAYTLSKKRLLGRRALAFYFLIPMYFGGGLVPTYLQVKALGLMNTPYTLIVLGGVSMFNMIVTRVFFSSSIPEELYESARIDGAGELRTFGSIALPLSKPILAVMTLFYAVAHWNSYFGALIYL